MHTEINRAAHTETKTFTLQSVMHIKWPYLFKSRIACAREIYFFTINQDLENNSNERKRKKDRKEEMLDVGKEFRRERRKILLNVQKWIQSIAVRFFWCRARITLGVAGSVSSFYLFLSLCVCVGLYFLASRAHFFSPHI